MEHIPKFIEQDEEYLTVDLGGIKVNLYKNPNRVKNTDPAYLGNVRVALWINTKRKQPIPATNDLRELR
jgi:hypothetical protein